MSNKLLFILAALLTAVMCALGASAKLNKLRFQRDDMERDIDKAVSLGLSREFIKESLGE